MEEGLASGERVYAANCAFCHGDSGDGRGPGASRLAIKPRDFTRGVFKFRSTPSGSLPLDSDLLMTVDRGLRGTGMIAWRARLTEAERWQVIHYLKRFSARFAQEQPGPAVPVPEPPPQTAALVAKGREVYQRAECWQCHGEQGRGDGPAAAALVDDWGQRVKPTDFVTGPLKRGDAPAEVYRTLVTGLDGSPMPSFAAALTDEERWAVAAYVLSLRDPRWAQRRFPEERMGEMLEMIGPMLRPREGAPEEPVP
jgi:cytochrome c oxidase cbb3-type subunit 2